MSDMDRLRRFLCLGSEQGTYDIYEHDLRREDASVVMRLIEDGKGDEVINELIKIRERSIAAKQEPILFALAMCSKLPDENHVNVRNAANHAVCQICRIPTHLFQYVSYCEHLARKTGWCRAQRAAVQRWYNERCPRELACYVTKYRSRSGWSHKDIITLAHVKPQQNGGFLQFLLRVGL